MQVKTTLYDTEKVLIVGNEDEHLVSMNTLYLYLRDRLNGEVLYCGTATELVG